MTSEHEHALTEAREVHRAGQLEAAQAAYESLLAVLPGHAEVTGLLGVLALQRGRFAEAEALLRAALAAGGDLRVRLRNLNNLLAALQRSGDRAAARALVAEDPPRWPEGAVPDAAERAMVLSLASALLLLGSAEAARSLLQAAIPLPAGDAAALGLTGRVMLACGENAEAMAALEEAAAEPAPEAETLAALAGLQSQQGQAGDARATMARLARLWPVHALPPRPSHRATLLVLSPAPETVLDPAGGLLSAHFSSNFVGQVVAALAAEFRFVSAFADLASGAASPDLPRVDAVLNNWVNAELLNAPGRMRPLTGLLGQIGAPVINRPEAVFATTRQKTAQLLQGIPGLRVPRIARYRTDLGPAEAIARDIEDRFGYPVILRKCWAHNSSRLQHSAHDRVAVLARDRAELDAALGLGWQEIYAIEFVELRRKAGYYRKIRAVLAEDEVIVAIPGFAAEWMVAGARGRQNGIDFYRANPETIEESRRIVLDPEGMLGPGCLAVLEAIRDRLPLDFCGIDFDVDEAGQVVFFEANAAMNLLKRPGEPADVTLPDAPFERVLAAFRRAVERRLEGV